MSIRDFSRILRRHVVLVVACLLVGVAVSGYTLLTNGSRYSARLELFVSSTGSDSPDSLLQNSTAAQQRAPSYAALVRSPAVMDAVKRRLGRKESAGAIARRIQATNPLQTALIEVEVRDRSARAAYDLARAIGEDFGPVLTAIESPAAGHDSPVKVAVISPPELPAQPDWLPVAWRLALGLVLGLAVGVTAAVVRDQLDTRVKDPAELRARLRLPLLGTIVTDREGRKRRSAIDGKLWSSPRAEGFRQVRTNLRVPMAADRMSSVVVAGPRSGDGSSAVALNLAIAFGLTGARVLLVDADLRNGPLSRLLGIDGRAGLADVLLGADAATMIQPWRDGTIDVLPAGPAPENPSELLQSNTMTELVHKLERDYDLVLFDAPPVVDVTDAAVLATSVSGTVLTVRQNATRWDAINGAVQAFDDVNAKVLGVVVLTTPPRRFRARRSARDAASIIPGLPDSDGPEQLPERADVPADEPPELVALPRQSPPPAPVGSDARPVDGSQVPEVESQVVGLATAPPRGQIYVRDRRRPGRPARAAVPVEDVATPGDTSQGRRR